MKHTSFILAFLLLLSLSSFAQVNKEERDERKAKAQTRVDYTVFRRQMLTLKEFSDERRHAAELQKTIKGIVRAIVYVDSTNEAEDKMLIGYITVLVANNPTNLYEVAFDRVAKKITNVKPTGETIEIDEDRKSAKKPSAKSTKDPDDDEEEEKPTRKRAKDDDDE